MNVCLLSPEYPPYVVGGLGAHVAHLAPVLAEKGVNVHVVTPCLNGGEAEETSGSLQVSRVDGGGDLPDDFLERAVVLNDYIYGRAAAIIGTQPGPWLLHAHDWLVGDAAIRLKQDYGAPLLATIHATEYGRNQGIWNEVQRRVHDQEFRLSNGADELIACSRFMANQIREVFSVPASRIEVVANGVDVDGRHDPAFDREAFRRRFVQDDEQLVLYVGRLVAEKGIYIAMDALPLALEVMPRIKFVIAGSGPALEDARSRAAGQEWSDHIEFTGFVPDHVRNGLYQVADAAMFPSTYEPFGIVALEAMAAGVPVVTSNAGGLTEVVDREETGVVVDAGQPDALAWGLVHILSQPALSRCRAERAYAKATSEFNWSAIADRTMFVYERMLRGLQ